MFSFRAPMAVLHRITASSLLFTYRRGDKEPRKRGQRTRSKAPAPCVAHARTAWSLGLWAVSTDTNTWFRSSGSSVTRTFSRVFSRKVSATLGSRKGSRTSSGAPPTGSLQTGPTNQHASRWGHLQVWTQNKVKTLEPGISYQNAKKSHFRKFRGHGSSYPLDPVLSAAGHSPVICLTTWRMISTRDRGFTLKHKHSRQHTGTSAFLPKPTSRVVPVLEVADEVLVQLWSQNMEKVTGRLASADPAGTAHGGHVSQETAFGY